MVPATTPAPRSYAALPLGWAALLLYLTLAPADKLPPQPHWQLLSFDTFAHAAFFAVQAALTWFSCRRQRRWPALARHAGWAVLLGCTAFGALIEGLQMALPFNRHGEWSDLISDSLGTAVALGLCYTAAPVLRRRGWVLGLAAVFGISGAQAQDMKRARQTIETLAAPQLHGRGYVKQGDKKAAAYLRKRFTQLNLQALGTAYIQRFSLDVNTFPGTVKLRIHRLQGPTERPSLGGTPFRRFQVGTEFIADAATPSHAVARSLLLPLDTLVFHNPALAAHYLEKESHTENKICLKCPRNFLLMRQSDESRLQTLPADVQQRIQQYGRVVLSRKLTASVATSQSKAVRLEVLSDKWPINEAMQEAEVKIKAQLRRNYQTQNLAAIIRGTAQPDSFLVVSAHYDHLGMMGRNAYFPGANDNASGVAMLLELAAHYARPENRPACSVVFLLFGAEEVGLLGSQYFVAHPLVPLKNIKFLVNLDLLGTGEQGATVVNGRLHEAAFRHLAAINDAHHYLPALGARGKAANSDHYPFSEAGVPAFFLYTRGGSPAYHDVNDKPAALSLAGFQGAFALVRDFLNELGAQPGE